MRSAAAAIPGSAACVSHGPAEDGVSELGGVAGVLALLGESGGTAGALGVRVYGERWALLSDKVCTALQLANFWQDVVEDEERGRRYLPAESMLRFGVEEGQIEGGFLRRSFAG